MATFKGLFKGKQVLVPMVLIKTLKDDSEKLTFQEIKLLEKLSN